MASNLRPYETIWWDLKGDHRKTTLDKVNGI